MPIADDSTSWRWRFEDAEFDEARMVLLVGGQPVAVEPKPLQLLVELLRRVNEAVTRDELFDAVWAGQLTVDHVLASAVNRLRKALGPAAASRIVTLPRIGYRLNGPVERLACGMAPVSTISLEPGQAIASRPAFRLVRRLGAGSGGEVWLASHATLGESRVFKFATQPEQLRALKREYTLHRLLRSELGDLEGLAPLLDAQLAEPPFHLESPWIGQSLPEWAASTPDWASMDTDARLALLTPVLQALASAHAVGVLHKDVKPSNILVTGSTGAWQTALADFGSGLAQDPGRLRKLGLTALGLTLTDQDAAARSGGTVLYLAPELLSGGTATTQSDLYAMGLVLFQCVVGDFHRPLSGAWQNDVACELLREDLAFATEADPARRLSSVRELLDRLRTLPQRRLALQQQRERDATAARIAADAAARRARRPWLIAGVAGLLLGLIVSLTQLWRAEQQRERAELASARAAAVSQFLHRDVMESASIIGIGRSFRPASLLDVLRKASAAAGTRFEGQPRTEGELRRRLTETFIELAAFPEADVDSERAVTLLASTSAADDEQLLLARFERVRVHSWRERFVAAADELELAESLAGPKRLQDTSLLAFAAVRARLLLTSHVHVRPDGSAPKARLPADRWLELARRQVQLADALAGPHGTDRAAARQMLSEALWWHGQRAEAEAVIDQLAGPPFNRRSAPIEFKARIHLFDGQQALSGRRYEEALDHLEQGVATLATSGETTNDFTRAWIEFEAGRVQLMLGHGEAAIRTLRAAQQRFRQLLGPEHHYIMTTERDIGIGHLFADRPSDALRAFDAAEEADLRILGRRRHQAWNGLLRAMAYNDLGRADDALRWLDAASAATAPSPGDKLQFDRLLRSERARALLSQGRRAEGMALWQQASASADPASLWPVMAKRVASRASGWGQR